MATAEAPEDPLRLFCTQLAELRADAGGPTLRELSRMPGVPSTSQLSDIFSGKIKKPPDRDVVRLLVLACLDRAGDRPLRGPSALAHWLARYDDLVVRWERPAATAVAGPTALTAPLDQWSPYSLGVHHAITVDGPPAAGAAPLTPYVPRRHDAQLRRLLADRPTALMAVLVGESSTGKTRGMLEAVRSSVPDWPITHPIDAETLLATIDTLRTPGVLWLNETQRYLDGPAGARVAQALHRLLSMPPGPVIVLGSMWLRQHWDRLTQRPSEGRPDPHLEVRELLLGLTHRIDVPPSFDDPGARSALEHQTRQDTRLAMANKTAHAGHVIQVLAGGVALANQYAHPTNPYGHAILSAAIDARRLGYRSLLPEALLRDAAPGYVSPQDRATEAAQTGQWFEDTFAYAQRPTHGVAALTPERAQAGMGEPDGFQLHDYLDQYGTLRRRSAPVPATTWSSLAQHTTSAEDRLSLIEQAMLRGQYHHAFSLSASLPPNSALPDVFTKYLERTDRLPSGRKNSTPAQADVDRAFERYQNAKARARLDEDNRPEHVDITRLLRRLTREGKHGEIESALRHAVQVGMPQADDHLVQWLDREGRTADAERARRDAFHFGRPHAYDRLVKRLLAAGRQDEAEDVLRQAIDRGTNEALYRLVNLLRATGKDAAVEEVLRTAVTAGHAQALGRLIDRLRTNGQDAEAERTLRHATLIGHSSGFPRLIVLLRQEDRHDEAEQVWRYGLTADGETSPAW